jgi:hypothetical protein
MESKIKLYRVLLNVLFYIFYILLVSIIFSFLFPFIMVLLWKEILDPSSPIFNNIQIWIIILVFIFTLTFRKYCYLPIKIKDNTTKIEIKETEVEDKSKELFNKKIKIDKFEEIIVDESINEEYEETPNLDIKIGKEIK